MNLLSENLTSALQEQIGHEKYNSSLYLFIGGFLKNKGLNRLAKHFEDQHLEEFNHSKMIYDFMTDLSAPIIIPEIDGINFEINSIVDIAQRYLDREIVTTTSLNEIKKIAIEEENCVAEEFLRKMIDLQRNEYAEATDFMDKAELVGNDWFKTLLLDLGSGA
jgi:ferritin